MVKVKRKKMVSHFGFSTYAHQIIQRFQTAYPSRPVSQLYGRNMIEKILAQKNVDGIYFAHAIDNSGAETLLMIGSTENGSLLFNGVIAKNAQ